MTRLVLHVYQEQAAGWRGGACGGTITGLENSRDVGDLVRASSDQNKCGYQISDHVVQESGAAHLID